MPAAELIERGGVALADGDWDAAAQDFEAALAQDGDDPDALLGLGSARWWTNRVAEAPALWERAYAGFRRRPDPMHAVLTAVNLSLTYRSNFGNEAAARGWAARAMRVAEEVDAPPLRGWALVTQSQVTEHPAQAQALIREAQGIATEVGDRDLELCALAALGSSLVDEGRVAEGTPLLDEAMAGTLGREYEELDTVVFTSCVLVQTCYRCADHARVVQWVRALRGFVDRYGHPYVNSVCRAHYGAVLVATGDWAAAEVELGVALDMAGDALPSVRAEASSFLAELRLAQGRPEDAMGHLGGLEDQVVAAPALAATHLALGDPQSATVVASRALDHMGARRLVVAHAAEVLGEARLALGDHEPAAEHGAGLVALGHEHGCDLLTARGARLAGRALAATESPAEARRLLDDAVGAFTRLEMPYETARTRTVLAEVLAAMDDPGAADAARRAHATFEELGAARDLDATAAWLREHGVTPAPRARSEDVLTAREREVLALLGEGLSNPEIADRLYLSRRTVEHHVARILAKLGLRNRTEAASYVARRGG